MSLLLSSCRYAARPSLWKCISSSIPVYQSNTRNVTTDVQQKPGESFMEKNTRLNRPLSPHLTIYKLQITSVLSVTHRFTGIVLSAGLYGLSMGMLILPNSYPYYIDYLQSLSVMSPLLFSLKFSLAWMFFYHMGNGIRHLAWDLGYGFELKNLYLSGYAVLGTSITLAAIAALL